MTIVVLNDGETWTGYEGCMVISGIPDDIDADEVKQIVAKGEHLQPVGYWDLPNFHYMGEEA